MMTKPLHLLVSLAALTAAAASFAPAADMMTDKPAWLGVGDMVPDVSLRDRNDQPVSLRATIAEKPTVLIFYRGGWCPFCNAHLAGLGAIQDDLQAAGCQLIAISVDRPAKLYDAPKRDMQPTFTLLSDQDAKAIDAFGLSYVVPDELVAKYKNSYGVDLEGDSGRTHHKLPHPAVYITNTKGKILFAYVNPDYKVRLEPAKILAAAKQAAMPGM